MPRKYTKKNDNYWNGLSEKNVSAIPPRSTNSEEPFEPKLVGDGSVSLASRLREPTERTITRSNAIHKGSVSDRFANIDEGLLPHVYEGGMVNISEAIVLCQKAYFNVPSFKSTLDLLSEFSNTRLYLEGGSATSKLFIEAWLKKAKIENLKDQFFLEYYRSGNVFFYQLNAKIKPSTINYFNLPKTSIESEIPVKYILLNPADVIVNGQLSFGEFRYAKALTPFEIERLKKSESPEEKAIFESLNKEVKNQLNNYSSVSTNTRILLELNPNIFHPIFYKKQDYEPLSVPMGFAVLDDINKKMELKKVDQAIARSIENVILLVTMGNEPDKGGINDVHLAAMQKIFENKSVGRVLVSDYTTNAEFIIPDLKRVMGKEKYEVLNKDIEEGLGNILLGESKYSDTELKLKLFFERLEAPKQAFLNDFLQPQINKICETFGFRKVPVIKFVKQDVINSEKLQKLITRMMELGIVTPEQGMETIHKGVFPDVEKMEEAQKAWKTQREEGLYTPLVSSTVFYNPEGMLLEGADVSQEKEEGENAGNPRDGGGRGGSPQTTSGPKTGTYQTKDGKVKKYPKRKKAQPFLLQVVGDQSGRLLHTLLTGFLKS
mgnify:FL=1